MAGAVEADRTIWVNADVAALWDRRERARRCLVAMFLSHSLSRVRQTGEEWKKQLELSSCRASVGVFTVDKRAAPFWGIRCLAG